MRDPHPAALLLLLSAMLLVAGPRCVIVAVGVAVELGVVARRPQVGVIVPATNHPLCGLTGEVTLTFPCHVLLLLWLSLPPQQVLFAPVVLMVPSARPLTVVVVIIIGGVVTLSLLMWRKLAELRRWRLLLLLRRRQRLGRISAPRALQLVVRDQSRLQRRGSGRVSGARAGGEVIPILVVSVRSAAAATRGS